jgi:hypothetical protein
MLRSLQGAVRQMQLCEERDFFIALPGGIKQCNGGAGDDPARDRPRAGAARGRSRAPVAARGTGDRLQRPALLRRGGGSTGAEIPGHVSGVQTRDLSSSPGEDRLRPVRAGVRSAIYLYLVVGRLLLTPGSAFVGRFRDGPSSIRIKRIAASFFRLPAGPDVPRLCPC